MVAENEEVADAGGLEGVQAAAVTAEAAAVGDAPAAAAAARVPRREERGAVGGRATGSGPPPAPAPAAPREGVADSIRGVAPRDGLNSIFITAQMTQTQLGANFIFYIAQRCSHHVPATLANGSLVLLIDEMTEFSTKST